MVTPNICEGRSLEVVEAVAAEVRSVKGVRLMNVSSDANHNRSVLSYIGSKEAVLAASFRMAAKTVELIDMRLHSGEHPRVGAVDAVPFIPVGGTDMSEAVETAHTFGRFMGSLGIPVYYYGEADTNPRENKAQVGKGKLTQELLGEYEGLPEKLKDDSWPPDEGPRIFSAKSGACTVGARGQLICFNVNLGTTDVAVAKRIARAVRFSGGGLRDVQAIGLALESQGVVQVSMMTSRVETTPLPMMLEAVRNQAARYGVPVVGTEINGPIPLSSLEDVFRHYLQAHDFSLDQIVENGLLALAGDVGETR
jgi:glutamate formiminotransferase